MPYSDPVKRRQYHLAYQRTHKHMWKDDRLRRVYGITLEKFNALVEIQQGLCRLCHRKYGDKLQVDHCHRTSVIRGLLCIPCNTRLGTYQAIKPQIDAFEDYLSGGNNKCLI